MAGKEVIELFREISSKHSLQLLVLYSYDLSKEKKSKAVRFVYLLKGRNKDKGIINEFKGRFIAPGCFLIPFKKYREMEEILAYWKIPFKRQFMLTP